MGQVLNNVLRYICICGEAEDESYQNPIEISSSHPVLNVSPPFIPLSKTITTSPEEFLQTHPSAYYNSCIHSSITTPPVSDPSSPDLSNLNPLISDTFSPDLSNLIPLNSDTFSPDLSNLIGGDSTSNTTTGLRQNLLPTPRSVLDYYSQRDSTIVVEVPVVIQEIRWIKHYNSFQKILLVGEGDFSFSASLAMAFGNARNIIATSLNSTGFLSNNYRSAMSNIQSLRSRGAKIMHEVDATKMANQILLQGMTFDRIVYNFPLSGFFPDESRESKLRRERKLVRLFIANAREMITERGEIHVTHKSNAFFRDWRLEELASSEGLQLIDEVHFNYTDFPGYRTKYGFGGDKNFNCNPSKTYKFGL